MSESKRFIKKDYGYDGCFFFDREQEFTDNVNKIPFYDVENLIPMTDEQVVGLLNGFCDEKEQLKNYFKKRAECSNFQINKLKEEIAELQEDNVDTIVELSKENEQLEKGKMEALSLLGEEIDKNEQLKQELQGMEELLQSYRKTIKHNAELLADATKNGYLPPLEDLQ